MLFILLNNNYITLNNNYIINNYIIILLTIMIKKYYYLFNSANLKYPYVYQFLMDNYLLMDHFCFFFLHRKTQL